ncbi:MAG: WG repeat-containing protein [Bacteroidales bacterium]|nr:WG repeat-containing protein [Bacteroidales bacterium]
MKKNEFEDCFEELPDGTTWVKVDGKWGCINLDGEWIIRPAYDDVWCWDWDKGLIRVRVGAKYGYIDNEGRWVIEPKLDDVTWFYEGMALAVVDRKWGVIDTTGKWIICPAWDEIEIIDGRCVRVRSVIDGEWRYFDNTGSAIEGPIA